MGTCRLRAFPADFEGLPLKMRGLLNMCALRVNANGRPEAGCARGLWINQRHGSERAREQEKRWQRRSRESIWCTWLRCSARRSSRFRCSSALGLGSVLGYLAAGLVIGPFGLKLFTSPQAILHVAELGVVMFLFIIGLEMQPSRLWALRREIFGLGAGAGRSSAAHCSPASASCSDFRRWWRSSPPWASCSRRPPSSCRSSRSAATLPSPHGQRIVSILLLEDLAIVPLLALVAFLAPASPEASGCAALASSRHRARCHRGAAWSAGKWLLNPLFRILAAAQAREVMTAAALLVVLGAALVMQLSGLSMAMGAFLAGVLLSESTFRHQLETDIEPFRGILLGAVFPRRRHVARPRACIARNWPLILARSCRPS